MLGLLIAPSAPSALVHHHAQIIAVRELRWTWAALRAAGALHPRFAARALGAVEHVTVALHRGPQHQQHDPCHHHQAPHDEHHPGEATLRVAGARREERVELDVELVVQITRA